MHPQAAAFLSRALTAPAANVPNAAPPPRLLVSAEEAAQMFGVSPRTYHEMRDRLPQPVHLSRTCVRWRVSELVEWVLALEAGRDAKAKDDRPAKMAAGRERRVTILALAEQYAHVLKAGDVDKAIREKTSVEAFKELIARRAAEGTGLEPRANAHSAADAASNPRVGSPNSVPAEADSHA